MGMLTDALHAAVSPAERDRQEEAAKQLRDRQEEEARQQRLSANRSHEIYELAARGLHIEVSGGKYDAGVSLEKFEKEYAAALREHRLMSLFCGEYIGTLRLSPYAVQGVSGMGQPPSPLPAP